MRKSKSTSKSSTGSGYALIGILECGHCGRPLFGKGRKPKSGPAVVRYMCRSAAMYRHTDCRTAFSVNEKDIVPIILEQLPNEIRACLNRDSVTPAFFREALLRRKCRATCWWKQIAPRR